MFETGSGRAAEVWKNYYKIDGVKNIKLHQLYRTMAWLGEELPKEQQSKKKFKSPRCIKDLIEENVFGRRQTLFSNFDMFFFDTTSIYFEGEGGDTIGKRGNSKDHRPDLKQMVVGITLDNEGNPVCSEMWPGNTTDVTTLLPVTDRIKNDFGVNKICVVADRGMICKGTMNQLEKEKREYILGARMRKTKEVKKNVLARGGRYKEVYAERQKSKDPSPLKVKEVKVRWKTIYNLSQ